METGYAEYESDEIVIAPPSRAKRVIVVEDDVDTRRLIAAMLRRDGYVVIEEEDGIGLLQHLQASIWNPRKAVDAIVSDIQMPDLTALEVIHSLPARHLGAPVVLVTAYPAEQASAEAATLGVVDVLSKPLDWRALRAAVTRAISVGGARRRWRARSMQPDVLM